ncbi:indolepyruvate ferredoxin oxidoreductase subunit alpha [Succinivibrio dextrinosolvens]|uniref:Indolepyruvate oxidoreductase subunit IorA n=1 Tax=Succinivibrio dextrinosolvens TaxID=83771 RepID=A0A662Z6C2_9GAMM|nr:indolepyruvate ferredoxin oxidoreductase subunit alpha [Succinivibrio dextrinosolvens]SFJ78908.1 indolepyruvate ferredoxin oxidoreductase alpha subunit [Succinivibrio dextrinosolvens]
MKKEYIMGNSAIALGALCSGVKLVAGYPGTPSTEIIETICKVPHKGVHLEWSVNEKAAMEVAAAGAYAGARTMVTMKQVGLNVASDPLMSLAYVGVRGGMVIVVADDPGPISSQTEQDTRRFASFCRIPVLDPSSPEEAFDMVKDAFVLSEKYHTPVILRPTTRVCHGYASISFDENYEAKDPSGFEKDSSKWVIFPKLSYNNHRLIEERLPVIAEDLSSYGYNRIIKDSKKSCKAVLASGISLAYVRECTSNLDLKVIGIASAFPLPKRFLLEALNGVDELICFEELSPFLEEELLKLCGEHQLKIRIKGKLTGDVPHSGELGVNKVQSILNKFLGRNDKSEGISFTEKIPDPPQRPPVLCAGCPHRGSFYAVKVATGRKKTYLCGDIGCYTLGNALPLDMVDTCLCMGAGITMAQGFNHLDKEAKSFAFIGDSTFFASGISGIVNAVYNEADITVCILDNATTAMTGHQPHPGTGFNLQGNYVDKIDIESVLKGIGVKKVMTVNPHDLKASVAAVKECMKVDGVKAIIFRAPCISIVKLKDKCRVMDKCSNCNICINKLGCPAMSLKNDKVVIDESLCVGCTLCAQLCPHKAIERIHHE